MIYVYMMTNNGYDGCDIDYVMSFPDDTSSEDIDTAFNRINFENAAEFEEMCIDSNNEYEVREYYSNLSGGWKFISEEDYYDCLAAGMDEVEDEQGF